MWYLLAILVPLSTTACGEKGFAASALGATSQALSQCDKAPFLSTKFAFASTGREVIVDTCEADGFGNPSFAVRDVASGAVVDFEKASDDDTVAFHEVRGGIGPHFQATIDAKTDDEPTMAEVWFRVDMSDEPAKVDQVTSQMVATAANTKRELRTRDAAVKLAQKLASIDDVQVLTNTSSAVEYGVPTIRVRATAAALHEIGTLSSVWRVMPLIDDAQLLSFNFNTTIRANVPTSFGYDGSGQTVAILEGNRPDAYNNLPGDPGGTCAPEAQYGGPSGKCHCPSGATGSHSRKVMGVVRAATGSIPFGGVARASTTISANWSPNCSSYGPDPFSSALNWATNQGARIINRSEGWAMDMETLNDDMQSSRDFLLDYKTTVYPYPMVVAGAGNDPTVVVLNRLRNGLVVGGGMENGGTDRAQVSCNAGNGAALKSYLNTNGPGGLEMPHLTAISEAVSVVPPVGVIPEDFPLGGTSLSSPQVAGIVAQLHEINPALQSWPEVVVPGLMVSADENTDAAHLNMHDGVDDRDGAGLVNAEVAWLTLNSSRKLDGGGAAQPRGHDYGYINTPTYTPYWEEWNAFVPAYHALRVAALLQSRPTCPANPGCNEPVGGCTASNYCSANPYVLFSLQVYDGTTLVAAANNLYNSYQFVRYVNVSGLDKTAVRRFAGRMIA